MHSNPKIMSRRIIITLKIISILALSVIHLPSDKISFAFGLSVLFTLIERISEFNLSPDLWLSLSFLLGMFMVFNKRKWLLLLGYSMMTIPFTFFITGKQLFRAGYLFWIPLFVFLIIAIFILVKAFREK